MIELLTTIPEGYACAPWCFMVGFATCIVSFVAVRRSMRAAAASAEQRDTSSPHAFAQAFALRGLASGRSLYELRALAHMRFAHVDPELCHAIEVELRRIERASTEKSAPPRGVSHDR